MKNLKEKILESIASDYLFSYAVMCDKDTSDYILATIDTDALPSSLNRTIKNLIIQNKVDKIMVCWENEMRQSYKEIVEGTIIDRDGQIFISTGTADGIDKDELFDKLYKNKEWTKKSMNEKKYVITSSESGKTREEVNEKDIKKLTKDMLE